MTTKEDMSRYQYHRIDKAGWGRTQPDESKTIHCAGPNDESPTVIVHKIYDGECGWCYLNAPHTQDLHDRSVAESYCKGV